MAGNWLVGDRHAAASDRILDIAGMLFADKGVEKTSIGDIARAAGCSRPTVYRYFEDKVTLQIAFVHRAARRLGTQVLESVANIEEPDDRLVAAVRESLAAVRGDPVLIAWFSPRNSSLASHIGAASPVIEAMCTEFVPEHLDNRELRARWLVRSILSFLLVPESSATEEAMVRSFVAPHVAPERTRRPSLH